MGTEKWMNCSLQRMMISGTRFSWQPVTSGTHRGPTQSPDLFSIFSNHLFEESESNLSKFTDGTKSERVTDQPEGCAAIQRHLNRLEKGSERHLLKLNKGKFTDLQVQGNTCRHKYMLKAPFWKAPWQKRT